MSKKNVTARKAREVHTIARVLVAIIALFFLCILVIGLTGCGNKQILDTTYSFEYAIISLPNGEIVEGKVTSWTDYEDGDQIQVKIDGKTYLVHSSNIALISE